MTDSMRDLTNGDDTAKTEMSKHVFLSAEDSNFKCIILEFETFYICYLKYNQHKYC